MPAVASTSAIPKKIPNSSPQTGFARKVCIRLLLCATSVCSVSLWLFFLSNNEPQRHRAHRGCTEKNVYAHFSCKAGSSGSSRTFRALWLVQILPKPRVNLLIPVATVLAFENPVVLVGPDDQTARDAQTLQDAPVFQSLIEWHTEIVLAN